MRRPWTALPVVLILLCVTFLISVDALAQCEIHAPQIVSSLEMPGVSSDIVLSGSYAYISDSTPSIQIVDISNPFSPSIVGEIRPIGYVQCMVASGSHIYVATEGATHLVEVFNVSNPLAPVPSDQLELPDEPLDIVVSGSYAYVVHDNGLLAIDISNPTALQPLGSIDPWYYPESVAVSGSFAYFLNGAGLYIIDISNPESLVQTARIHLSNHVCYDVSIVGGLVYVSASRNGIEIIDVSDPTSPRSVGTFDDMLTRTRIISSGKLGYTTRLNAGLQIIDISDPFRPHLVGSAIMPSVACDVAISGSYAFVADREWGLQVVDISQPYTPHEISSADTPGWAQGIALSGAYAYIADGSSGLQIVDISNPHDPVATGVADTPGTARDLAVLGSYAYLADESTGLQIVDITDPYAPVVVGSMATADAAYDVAVAGSHAYVAAKDGYLYGLLEIIDISDPFSPSLVGSVKIPGVANGVALSGSYALVADGQYALQVVDVSNANSPFIVGSVDLPDAAKAVTVFGSYAYVAAHNAGLQVVDISDPNIPVLTGSVEMPWANDVYVAEPYAFVRCSYGVWIIDVSDPFSPQELALMSTGEAVRLAVSGRYAYIAAEELDIFDLCPTVGPFPTIGRSITTIANTGDQGSNAPDQTFEVWNSGEGTLKYFLSSSTDWLAFEPDTGASLGEHDSIIVHYNSTALSPGMHSARITISQPHAINNPQYIDVTLLVNPTTRIVVTNVSPMESGTVSGGGTYDYGETATVEAYPNASWLFDHWEGADISGSRSNPESITMNSDKNVTAVFVPFMPELKTYRIPLLAGNVTGDGTFAYMETAIVEAIPNLGWEFDYWEWTEIDGSTNNPEYVTMDSDKTVRAVFRRAELTGIYLSKPPNASICDTPPYFSWTSDGGEVNRYAIDFFVSPQILFWSTFDDMQLKIWREYWYMPSYIYDAIPHGSFVYWRVRAVDAGVRPPIVAYSNDVWWFCKP